MAASDFAKRQLKKHGWTEGSGLGKQEDGRSEPIKVSLKMDKSGVGHDPGKEFTDHWWLRVFNEAAQKIGKKKQDDLKADEDSKLTEKKNTKNKLYNNFVKSTTLTNGVDEKHRNSDSSSDESTDHGNNTSVPTLNDIHKFCGGATGHKAAGFGIKMGGKLARIAEHDKMFEEGLEKEKRSSMSKKVTFAKDNSHDNMREMSSLNSESPSSKDIPCESSGGKRKKKKHRKDKYSVDNDSHCLTQKLTGGFDETQDDKVPETTVCKKNKLKKKHKKKTYNDNIEERSVNELPKNNETQHEDTRKKKKRKRSSVTSENDMPEIKPSKKKAAKDNICSSELVEDSKSNDIRKKKKRKKH
uniref:G patch domain-containing protein 4 n=1 Tax=Arion vulgaris TaxID=1028688 RepID=A0A0B7AB89_9EUPU